MKVRAAHKHRILDVLGTPKRLDGSWWELRREEVEEAAIAYGACPRSVMPATFLTGLRGWAPVTPDCTAP